MVSAFSGICSHNNLSLWTSLLGTSPPDLLHSCLLSHFSLPLCLASCMPCSHNLSSSEFVSPIKRIHNVSVLSGEVIINEMK